jgi:uncharacterized protein YuzE
MKTKYSDDTDILIIELKDDKPIDSKDLDEGIIVHFNKKREPIEIEIPDASSLTNISEIGLSLPQKTRMISQSI